MSRELELFQVNDYTWMSMKTVSDRSYRIVQQPTNKQANDHHTYGIYYEGLSSPGIRPVRTDIENFELAKVYLAYILRKEKEK